MSTIAQKLRQLAAARLVGMEAADESAVQGDSKELSDEELKNVADKAAETLPPEDGEEGTAETTDATDTTGAEDTGAEAGTEETTETGGDDFPPAEGGTEEGAAEPPSDEPTADEIETPAEGDLENLAASGEEGAEAVAEATSEQTETADDTVDADISAIDETADAGTSEAGTDDGLGGESDAGGDMGDVEGSSEGDLGGDAATDPLNETGATEGEPAADLGEAATDAGAEAGTEEAADAAPLAEEAAASTDGQPEAAAGGEEVTEAQQPADGSVAEVGSRGAVGQAVNLVEAVSEARSAAEVVKQVRAVSDELFDVAETVEVINDGGGVTMESLALLQHALRGPERVLERSIGVGVTFESFAGQSIDTRLQVSIEEIAGVIADLEGYQPELERQEVESLDRIRVAVLDAIPAVRERLQSVISKATVNELDGGGQVQIDSGLATALSVDGAFPTDLGDAIQQYIETGKRILGTYSEKAFRGVREASLINNVIDFSSAGAFWEKVGLQVDQVCDPRDTLSGAMLTSTLPGGARLFDSTDGGEPSNVSNEVLKKLVCYNSNRLPMEVTVCTEAVEGSSQPALSSAKMVLIGNAMLELSCLEKIECVLKQGADLWPEAQDAIRFLRESFRYAPEEIGMETSAHFQQIVKFVETSYSLSTWPLVQYLANFILTANAFVLYCELSLKPQEAAPVVEEVAVVEETAPVTEETTSVEEELPPTTEEVAADAETTGTEGEEENLEDLGDLSLESLQDRSMKLSQEMVRYQTAIALRLQK